MGSAASRLFRGWALWLPSRGIRGSLCPIPFPTWEPVGMDLILDQREKPISAPMGVLSPCHSLRERRRILHHPLGLKSLHQHPSGWERSGNHQALTPPRAQGMSPIPSIPGFWWARNPAAPPGSLYPMGFAALALGEVWLGSGPTTPEPSTWKWEQPLFPRSRSRI